ncbi:hypothetical protein RJ035_007875 [Blastomyces gilchristii]
MALSRASSHNEVTDTAEVPHRGPDHNLITFKLNDPENPKNWSKARKWYITKVELYLASFVVAFDSSVITAGIGKVAEEFDIGEIVDLLTIAVCGIGFQSVEPMSEMFGRKPVYVPTLSVAVVFLITEYIVSGAVWALVTFTAPETSTGTLPRFSSTGPKR